MTTLQRILKQERDRAREDAKWRKAQFRALERRRKKRKKGRAARLRNKTESYCHAHVPATTYVYAIQAGTDGPIKLGFSKDPRRRLKALQTACALPLVMLGVREGTRAFEQELHRRFAPYHATGEWFHPHEAVLAEISGWDSCDR